MPPAVRLLCPWDRHVDVRSAWSHGNSIAPQTFAFRRRNLTWIKHEFNQARESSVPIERVSTSAVPLELWSIPATTHPLRGGLIMFRPRCGLAAWLFNVPFAPQVSATNCASKNSLPFSDINIVARTSGATAAQRRNFNSSAPFGFAQGRLQCREGCPRKSSPLQRTAPRVTR